MFSTQSQDSNILYSFIQPQNEWLDSPFRSCPEELIAYILDTAENPLARQTCRAFNNLILENYARAWQRLGEAALLSLKGRINIISRITKHPLDRMQMLFKSIHMEWLRQCEIYALSKQHMPIADLALHLSSSRQTLSAEDLLKIQEELDSSPRKIRYYDIRQVWERLCKVDRKLPIFFLIKKIRFWQQLKGRSISPPLSD